MKKLFVIIFVVACIFSVNAQFKDSGFHNTEIREGILNNSSNSLFGFLNTDDFQMRQSYSLSFSTFGNGQGTSLGVLTNSMFYRFANNLNGQVDISLVHSPYSTFGKNYQNNINGIYISRAALNYRPWNDVLISIQYRNLPNTYYYNPYYSPFNSYGFNHFDSDFNNGFLFDR